jgi:hypothetical protein
MTDQGNEIRKCGRHPARGAVAACVECGTPVCGECAVFRDGRYYCEAHAPAPADPKRARRVGPFRPAYLLAVAAAVAAVWGVLYLLRPAAEKTAAFYTVEISRLRLDDVAAAARAFRRDMGRYPTGDEGLKVLVTEPADGEKWLGPYLAETFVKDGEVVDASSRPVGYRVTPEGHVLYAAGADGELYTADDATLVIEKAGDERPGWPALKRALKR